MVEQNQQGHGSGPTSQQGHGSHPGTGNMPGAYAHLLEQVRACTSLQQGIGVLMTGLGKTTMSSLGPQFTGLIEGKGHPPATIAVNSIDIPLFKVLISYLEHGQQEAATWCEALLANTPEYGEAEGAGNKAGQTASRAAYAP